MADFPSLDWMTGFKEKVNADKEMSVIGTWFDTSIELGVGDCRVVLKVEEGKITDIIESPGLDVRSSFGLRAPDATWAKFLAPDPEPLYHDFFAMLMRVPEFNIDGDTLVAMQNARALHRMMNIMREMGASHA